MKHKRLLDYTSKDFNMREIKLGEKVKDIVSGFTGIAIARTEYLNGCIQYTVQSKKGKDNEIKNVDIDEEQIKKVDDGILKKKKVTNTGGPKKSVVKTATY